MPPSGPLPTPDPSALVTPEPAPASPGSAVTEDPSLLEVLPPEVAGIAVEHETLAFADAATDPAFAANVEAGAFFVAVDAADLASGVVARLRAGVFSDGFFRDWRDSYNEGACGQAGGVAGNAEAELGGRVTHISTCAGGLTVYHAYLDEPGLLVSLISVGERRLGEQLMRDLRP